MSAPVIEMNPDTTDEFVDLDAPAPADDSLDEAGPPTVTFSADQLPRAQKIIADANRRLARAGVADAEFTLTVINREYCGETVDGGARTAVDTITAEISHPVISVGGWTFVAKIEHDQVSDAILVRERPENDVEFTIPTTMHCDHCRTNRARLTCYLISNTETGELMQVGGQCVQPFLGLSVAALWWLDLGPMAALDDLGFSQGVAAVQRDFTLAVAWVLTDEGRTYRPSSFEHPTKGAVADVLFPSTRETLAQKEVRLQVLEQAEQIPADTISAIVASAQTLSADSSYGHTMQALVGAEWVAVKNLGFLVSLVKVYRNLIEKEREAAIKAAAVAAGEGPKPGLYAPEGDVITDVAGVVTDWFSFSTAYGTSACILIRTADTGHQLKWMSGADLAFDLDKGDKIVIDRARVKSLDTYNDVESTMITRPKITVTEKAEER